MSVQIDYTAMQSPASMIMTGIFFCTVFELMARASVYVITGLLHNVVKFMSKAFTTRVVAKVKEKKKMKKGASAWDESAETRLFGRTAWKVV